MADGTQPIAGLIEKLGRERTAADARTIGLEDTEDLADAVGRDAEPGADPGTDGIGRSDERIRTEVDVEQGALRPLGQDALTLGKSAVDEILAVDEAEALEELDGLEPLAFEPGEVIRIIETAENALVTGLGAAVNLPEIGTEQIADAHAAAADLVGIGRTDALARGADFGAALGGLVSGVEQTVGRQNQMGLLGDAELAREVVTALGQLLGLGAEQNGVDDHTVTDDIGLAALEDTRRNGPQDVLLAVELQRMPGVGAALEPGDDIVTRSEHVHDLALALVAPLQPEDHIDFFHAIAYS